ncbi:MAG: cyclic nucleotide-binding domain-containing protein [Gammaproteobacteria bacterium]|nr:cyclic nucleotide-binding domain-containing protein [Gammaproteobacteria bacterium]MCW5583239.1 cyclic nucleotide-binding domain-containing protein [Gammaproteobacteria bacterium]
MDRLDFLKRQSELFFGLSEQQLKVIADESREIKVEKEEVILHENEVSDDIFIIVQGEAAIIKSDPTTGLSHQIGTLYPGDIIGEISLIDDAPRSASVRITKPSTLIMLSIKKLRAHAKEEYSFSKTLSDRNKNDNGELPTYAVMVHNVAKQLSKRLRMTNETVVEALRNELMQVKAREAMGRFIITIVVILSLYVIVLNAIETYRPTITSTAFISIPLLILFAIPSFIAMKLSGYPMELYGFTIKGWRWSVIESLAYTFIMLGIVVLYKLVLLHYNSRFSGRHLFDFTLNLGPGRDKPISFLYGTLIICLYLLFVPMQELLARGALQSSFQVLLIGRYKTLWAILLSNLLFSVLHTHVSFGFGLIVYIPGLFWGWLYARQKTLIGPTISHLIVGAWAVFIVGLI